MSAGASPVVPTGPEQMARQAESIATNETMDKLVDRLGIFNRSLTWPHGEAAVQRTPAGEAMRRWLVKQSPKARAETLTLRDVPWLEVTLKMAALQAREVRGEG